MEYAYERQIGTRRLNGTDWPVRVVVYRSGRQWICATICNGIADGSTEFSTRREAVERAMEAL